MAKPARAARAAGPACLICLCCCCGILSRCIRLPGTLYLHIFSVSSCAPATACPILAPTSPFPAQERRLSCSAASTSDATPAPPAVPSPAAAPAPAGAAAPPLSQTLLTASQRQQLETYLDYLLEVNQARFWL